VVLHLLKLCVGCDSVDDLRRSVDSAMVRRRASGLPEVYVHKTRMVPRRAGELVAGGSLYWVIRGQVQCRQEIAAIEPFVDAEGVSRCRLALKPVVVATLRQPRRAFQGWRYLKPADAPGDLHAGDGGQEDLPAGLRLELAELGLL
jgi:hypothetical protein